MGLTGRGFEYTLALKGLGPDGDDRDGEEMLPARHGMDDMFSRRSLPQEKARGNSWRQSGQRTRAKPVGIDSSNF